MLPKQKKREKIGLFCRGAFTANNLFAVAAKPFDYLARVREPFRVGARGKRRDRFARDDVLAGLCGIFGMARTARWHAVVLSKSFAKESRAPPGIRTELRVLACCLGCERGEKIARRLWLLGMSSEAVRQKCDRDDNLFEFHMLLPEDRCSNCGGTN